MANFDEFFYLNILNPVRNERTRLLNIDAFDLNENRFMKIFRLRKIDVEYLQEVLRPFLPVPQRATAISNQRKILCALRFFGGGGYQMDMGISQFCGLSQPSVSRAINEVVEAFNHPAILNAYIHFPNTIVELASSRQKFFDKFGLPGIIGCIDCSHVAIFTPSENEHIFVNRRRYHSLNVQMICDENMKLINVNPRYPGSTHDSFIWRNSNIERLLSTLPQNHLGGFYLFGDSGYPLRPWLITPINQEPMRGTAEYRFNKRFKEIRALIERTYGLLKNRFRCIIKYRVLHYSPLTAAKIVNSCAVLHNICVERNVPLIDDEDVVDDDEDDLNNPDNDHRVADIEADDMLARGRAIRQNLINNYFN